MIHQSYYEQGEVIMKFAQIQCPNCGSKIKNELMSSRITCPYCHTEVYIDDDAGAFDRKLHSVTNAFDRINKSTNDTKSKNQISNLK